MSRGYLITNGKEVWQELEKVYHYSNYFEDWIDLILNSLLTLTDNLQREGLIEKFKENKLDGKYEARYMEIAKRYESDRKIGERPMDYFAKAWGLLMKETQEKQKDILGEIYQSRITHGEHGQFFTPEHITDFFSELIEPKNNEKINDPCCGSGRMLISASKKSPDALFFGTDLDSRCAKMAVLNMFIFNLNAEIYWGNSLSHEMFKRWITRKGGFVFESDVEKEEIKPVLQPAYSFNEQGQGVFNFL